MNDFKELPINADRICEAISKIGYNPSAAILDIIDNSVVARAKEIKLNLFIKEGTNVNSSQNISKIQIIDNGRGMLNDDVEKALHLGSDVDYEKNSLSKYGLGLKSAGFSLGNRIEVYSKKNDIVSNLMYLDRSIIKKKNAFGIETIKTSKEQEDILKESNGTVVTIDSISYTSRVSANRILKNIEDVAGVVYYDILKSQGVTISVDILKTNGDILKKSEIKSKDILFWDKAHTSFKKESYECKLPCRVLDTTFENPMNKNGESISIKAVIFPMDMMKSFQGFNEEERKLIKSYGVGNKNSGFFFYRNGRLIKWGEKLFLNRVFGFRAKIDFITEHDELFGVDVSKQHLTVPEEIETTIKYLCEKPISQSKEIFEMCNSLVRDAENVKEGAEFNRRNIDLEEDDEEILGIDKCEVDKRKKNLEQESDDLLKETNEEKYDEVDAEKIFQRIRYWDKAKTLNLWESCVDHVEGTYSLINKKHPYYNHTLANFGTTDPVRQTIEAFIHALSVGEIQTIGKFLDSEEETVKKVFQKFLRTVSHQLDNWVNNNWDLFDNGN